MSQPYRFGLIGHNVSYSKSSDIFEAIFAIKKIKGAFENYDLEASTFAVKFKTIVGNGIHGLSVTIPYKSRVIELLDEVTPVAQALDAVNSIAIDDGKLQGHNTDVFGFSLPLNPVVENLKRGHALILGCGGSARAIIYSLYTDYEIDRCTVLGRSYEKLNAFKELLKLSLVKSEITSVTYDDWTSERDDRFNVVVNCTPLGGWNHPDKSPLPLEFKWKSTRIYYDLNYNLDNKVVRQAKDHNVTAFDGSQMLVGQAIRSFEIWTGLTVDFDEVYDLVFDRSKQSA